MPCDIPMQTAGVYTPDIATQAEGAAYLYIIAWNYIPVAIIALLSTMFRCMNHSRLALYISVLSTALNIALDYLLIFGIMGLPRMGSRGAALATVLAHWNGGIETLFLDSFSTHNVNFFLADC